MEGRSSGVEGHPELGLDRHRHAHPGEPASHPTVATLEVAQACTHTQSRSQLLVHTPKESFVIERPRLALGTFSADIFAMCRPELISIMTQMRRWDEVRCLVGQREVWDNRAVTGSSPFHAVQTLGRLKVNYRNLKRCVRMH